MLVQLFWEAKGIDLKKSTFHQLCSCELDLYYLSKHAAYSQPIILQAKKVYCGIQYRTLPVMISLPKPSCIISLIQILWMDLFLSCMSINIHVFTPLFRIFFSESFTWYLQFIRFSSYLHKWSNNECKGKIIVHFFQEIFVKMFICW